MKDEKKTQPVSNEKKSGAGSNPKNKVKKGTTSATLDNTITSAVGKVKAKSGRGLANEGTNVDYNEER